tara:strand:+ start:2258 stop:3355 length:1098 start_codon:yes stop_codon:yes gene_type:complete
MAQYRNINVRSPFYVQHPTTELLTLLSIRIWTGDVVTNKPTSYNYILEKEQTGGQSTFEIAELIRDFCSQTSDVSSGTVWVETTLDDNVNTPTVVIYLASEGYSLYNEGIQHNGNSFESDFVALPTISISGLKEHRQITNPDAPTWIPVYVQPQNSTDWKYRFVVNGTPGGYIPFPVETDNDKMFKEVLANPGADSVEFDFNGVSSTVYMDVISETKYNHGQLSSSLDRAVTVQYANKFGARSYMVFELKHTESVEVSSKSFQRNTMDVGNLSNGSGLHASRRRVTGSKQSFTVNTGWINEYHVKQLEELLMSEYVWVKFLHIGNNFLPVNLKTQNLAKKNHLNDKLIQYTFKLETASEYMNTVR